MRGSRYWWRLLEIECYGPEFELVDKYNGLKPPQGLSSVTVKPVSWTQCEWSVEGGPSPASGTASSEREACEAAVRHLGLNLDDIEWPVPDPEDGEGSVEVNSE